MISDPRHILNGWEIPTDSYCDQPFIVQTDDGAWLCSVTTGPGHEGERGQHVTTLRSTDQGRTWSKPVPVEPADSPENSYAVMLKAPSGRVYIFYNHNTDNVREITDINGNAVRRVDSLGYYVFRYSDDHGRSWSDKRYVMPVREFAIDRENITGGQIRFFWNVGKPFVHDGAAHLSLHKVGNFGPGFFVRTEGVLVRCEEILTADDPDSFTWQTLPDGDIGLRTPPGGGPVAEEHSYSVLSDGSFYVIYRTIDGHPVEAYSRDGGHTWSQPRYARYANGRLIKQPRAATFAWKCRNGNYLLWFHNLGGRFIRDMWGQDSATNGLVFSGAGSPYDDRNPAWLAGGVEVETPDGLEIAWSQPEVAIYHDDPYVRMSYPDLVEEDGRYFVTETQKEEARVHELDRALLDGLWRQADQTGMVTGGLILDTEGDTTAPSLPHLLCRDGNRLDFGTRDLRAGFSLDLELQLDSLEPGQVLVDNRLPTGKGLALVTTANGTLELILDDGRTDNRWACDPGMLRAGQSHHLCVIVDGGPKLILFVVDGVLCDGGADRSFGWGRFSPNLQQANGGDRLRLAPAVRRLRVYDRALRTHEAVANSQSSAASS